MLVITALTSDDVITRLGRNVRCRKLEDRRVAVSETPPIQPDMQDGVQPEGAVSIVDILYTVPRLLQVLGKSHLHLLQATSTA